MLDIDIDIFFSLFLTLDLDWVVQWWRKRTVFFQLLLDTCKWNNMEMCSTLTWYWVVAVMLASYVKRLPRFLPSRLEHLWGCSAQQHVQQHSCVYDLHMTVYMNVHICFFSLPVYKYGWPHWSERDLFLWTNLDDAPKIVLTSLAAIDRMLVLNALMLHVPCVLKFWLNATWKIFAIWRR